MRLVDVDSLYRHLFTCSDGRICPNTDIDNWPIQFDVKTIKKIIRKEPIVFEFDIPDNATNGEVFGKIMDYMFMDDAYITTDKHGYLHLRGVKDDWWNAPYQKSGNSEYLGGELYEGEFENR